MTLRKIVSRTAAALALAFAGTAHAHEVAEPKPGPAMWKVSDEDTTIYLFGTIHILPKGIDWYDARIASAFAQSDTLVTEIDMRQATEAGQRVAAMAALAGDKTLRDLMTEDDRAQYEAALATLEMPAPALDGFEPWFAAANLGLLPLVKAGYDPGAGVEVALIGRAEGKERGALETIEEQTGYLDTLPMDSQLTMLDQTVESIDRMPAMIDGMIAEWLAGDADSLARIMNDEMADPLLYQRLLVDRNANWAAWIAQRLETPGTVFVAVGAGHLAGQGSVQEMLAERGLMAERIWE